MTGTYAAKTEVSISKSRDEIERTLSRFGASAFGYFTNDSGQVAISFEIKNVRILMRMQLPDRSSFTHNSYGKRSDSVIEKDWEQACRQRWRSLANGIKAKLALIDDEISTVEREFLADIIIPSTGQTYGEYAIPHIIEVYEKGGLPPMMPGLPQPNKVIELSERTAR